MDFTKTLSVEELSELRKAILEDGKVSKEEMDDLFKIKDQQPELTPEFCSLFTEMGMKYLTDDDKIDADEAQYLIDMIGADNKVDSAEEELLCAIADFALEHDVDAKLVEAFPEFF